MHDVLIVGVPTLMILAGILFGHNDTKQLREDMNRSFGNVDLRFNKIEDHLSRIDADLRQFYHLTGKLEARMDGLEKRS